MIDYEEVPSFFFEAIGIGVLALLTDSVLFAILAVLTWCAVFYIEWKEHRFSWNFGLNEGVRDEQIREA